MPDALLTWALTVYCAFHVLGRSDILRRPREWAQQHLPRKLTYPLTCAFCFAFWCGLALTAVASLYTGTLILSASILFAAPVFNMVLDLAVRALLKVNEPPLLTVTTPSVWTGPSYQPDISWTTFSWMGETLSTPLHTGRRARVARGRWSYKGKEGLITRHFICTDDCAGTFRKAVYDIEGVASKVEAADCDLIDTPPAPPTPAA